MRGEDFPVAARTPGLVFSTCASPGRGKVNEELLPSSSLQQTCSGTWRGGSLQAVSGLPGSTIALFSPGEAMPVDKRRLGSPCRSEGAIQSGKRRAAVALIACLPMMIASIDIGAPASDVPGPWRGSGAHPERWLNN